jgi:hypothetical protein
MRDLTSRYQETRELLAQAYHKSFGVNKRNEPQPAQERQVILGLQ